MPRMCRADLHFDLERTVSMGILVACLMVAFILVSLGLLALWYLSTWRQDARLAQIEKQVAIDGRCFAHQSRLHHKQLDDLDLRLQCMAREMVTRVSLEQTIPAPVDRSKHTPLRPPAP